MLTGSEGMLEMQRKATLQDTVREADFLCRKDRYPSISTVSHKEQK
jgi:hypothetical protein